MGLKFDKLTAIISLGIVTAGVIITTVSGVTRYKELKVLELDALSAKAELYEQTMARTQRLVDYSELGITDNLDWVTKAMDEMNRLTSLNELYNYNLGIEGIVLASLTDTDDVSKAVRETFEKDGKVVSETAVTYEKTSKLYNEELDTLWGNIYKKLGVYNGLEELDTGLIK